MSDGPKSPQESLNKSGAERSGTNRPFLRHQRAEEDGRAGDVAAHPCDRQKWGLSSAKMRVHSLRDFVSLEDLVNQDDGEQYDESQASQQQ